MSNAQDPAQPVDTWASGDAYAPFVGRWSRLVAQDFIDWLDILAGSRWLDVACGTGALSQAILQSAMPGQLQGMDHSAAYIAFARAKIQDQRSQFHVADAQALSVVSASYQAVVSGLMLNFVPRPDVVVAEMVRAAQPGGTVAAYVWDYGAKMQFLRHFWNAATALDPAAHSLDEGQRFRLCHPEPLRQLFRDTGLCMVEVRPIDIATDFRDVDDYWSPFLGGQGPAPGYAKSLSTAQRSALRERLLESLSFAVDGTIPLVARAWAVRGVR